MKGDSFMSTNTNKQAGRQIIWSTERVEEAKEKISNGFLLKKADSPFHEGMLGVRKANAVFAMTPEEEEEYIKCYLDVMYFAEKYCYVKSEDGKHKIIELRPYQVDILKMYKENRFSILMSSRQSGKTICSAIYILHYILFNNQKNVLITANQWKTIDDIVDKIKEIYINLPFFLKKGVTIWNQKSFAFDNKSRVRTSTVTKSSGVGQNVDFLYCDEFAVPEPKVLEKFYLAIYPTVSSIENSKIIITSTPRGYNLFYKLLTDAERPAGDPEKNPYTAMRVYWHSMKERFCTYIRLNRDRMHELKIDKDELYRYIESQYSDRTKCKMFFNTEINKDQINVYNNDYCTEEDVLSIEYDGRNIREFADLTTWKKETIKAIGGEDAFNQEYGLQFVTANRSLLSERLINDLVTNKKEFRFLDIDRFNQKLRFNWNDLKWNSDSSIFDFNLRKKYNVIISLDISEGLGNDYTVINIFKISEKKWEWIEPNLHMFDKLSDFFCLEQIGMYRSNVISVAQLADLLYLISYEFFDPEKVKIVLELNYGGPELLAYLPNVFDGNNSYGSNIFFRYKHRLDSVEEKIGLKVTSSKNMMVKDYQDSLHRRDIIVYDEDNIRELTTFVKHETSAGNTSFKSDSGNDDTVMTVVNATTIFKKSYYINIIEDIYKSCGVEFRNLVGECLKTIDKTTGTDYNTFINTARKIRALRGNSYGSSWYNKK